VDKLNKTLLINRIDPHNYSNDKRKIFFLIGRLNIKSEEDRLMEILNSIDILEKTDIIYKYNGVVLNIKLKQIPKINKILAKKDIEIYSIFEMYNPEI
jgi:hypothetical protein